MSRLSALLFLFTLGSGLAMAEGVVPALPSSLGQLWKASLSAETNKDYASAIGDMISYRNSGGNAFLANLRTAWLYYLKQDYADAAKFYNDAERLQPSSINPLLGLLNVSEAQGQEAEIEKAAENILHLDPLNYRAQMVSAYRQYLARNYAVALADYRRILTYYPDDLTALSGEAWSLYHIGQEEKAAADFQTLLSVNADDTWSQKGLALCRSPKSD